METERKADPGSLHQSLLSSAQWHAKNAFYLWASSDYNERLASSISAGVAVELLLKHILALKSPLLLSPLKSERAPGIASRAAFASDNFGPHLAKVQSCSAEEAFNMVVSTIVGRAPLGRDEFTAVLAVRNAASHLAVLFPEEELRDAIYSVIKMFERVGAHDAVWASSFLSEADVAVFMDDYQQDRARFAVQKIEGAGSAYFAVQRPNERPPGMDVEQNGFLDRQAYLIFGPDPENWGYFFPDVQEHKCVACKQLGLMLFGAEGSYIDAEGKETEEYDDENVGVILTAVGFACPHCGLQLTWRELAALADDGNGWARNATERVGQRNEEYIRSGNAYTVSILKEY